jgi:hypothetical protein
MEKGLTQNHLEQIQKLLADYHKIQAIIDTWLCCTGVCKVNFTGITIHEPDEAPQ